ncbi:MAG: ribosome maturation factor RimP [Gaiellaceae bacterium]|jgi:ribosome maturation factor RimP|nr:ribosome maturation factor RimP [Gaiellaceae bacterium]
MPSVHEKERTLEHEIRGKVEEALPGVEVLAVELTGPERLTVYVDREAEAVDLALCQQVTRVLADYLREYGVDVSSPGPERPLRRPEHFQRALGKSVKLKTERRKLRGEVTRADDQAVTVAADGSEIDIPYDEIVRGNLIEEKEGR